jgi:hypothetical protein
MPKAKAKAKKKLSTTAAPTATNSTSPDLGLGPSGPTVPLAQKEKTMSPNQNPAPGSPAQILSTFVASDLTSNSRYAQALNLMNLFNQLALQIPELKVLDIVAIQTNISDGAADAQSFSTLRSYGITEQDFLNLWLKRADHGDTPQLSNVGKAFEILRSVGNDANGRPNKFQALLMLIEEQNIPNVRLKPQDIPALLLGFEKVREAAEIELSKYF